MIKLINKACNKYQVAKMRSKKIKTKRILIKIMAIMIRIMI